MIKLKIPKIEKINEEIIKELMNKLITAGLTVKHKIKYKKNKQIKVMVPKRKLLLKVFKFNKDTRHEKINNDGKKTSNLFRLLNK